MTPSTAGGSAQREYERRRVARESRIREKFGRAAGLVLAMTDEPASTKAWATGAAGERKTARRLDAIAQLGGVVLHDRGIAGSRSNIDHLVIISSGVVVIDSKMYSGRIEVRRDSLKVKGRGPDSSPRGAPASGRHGERAHPWSARHRCIVFCRW